MTDNKHQSWMLPVLKNLVVSDNKTITSASTAVYLISLICSEHPSRMFSVEYSLDINE